MQTFCLGILAAALLPGIADGFMLPAAHVVRPSHSLHAVAATIMQASGGSGRPLSYTERLKQARAAKAAASTGAGKGAGGDHQQTPVSPTTPMRPAASPTGRPMNPRGEPIMDEPEIPFSTSVYEEIRTAITILAARLQREQPLSREEFERFEAAVAIIVEDALPYQELPTQAAKAPVGDDVAAGAPANSVVSSARRRTGDEVQNEGPAWDPAAGGYGLPTNTQNTYVIEGMSGMSPDEYQEALRQRVNARARSARNSGSYGNIVSNDYLRFLNKNPKSDDEEKIKEQETKKNHEDFRHYK